MKLKIVRFKDDSDGYLGYYPTACPMYVPDILDEHPVMKLEELVHMCDQTAESRNNHDFVGTHRILATLLFNKLGRKKTTEIMLEIAEYGGLDAMSGNYADELKDHLNAFKDLGIKQPWHEWSLPEEQPSSQSQEVAP